jgi:hypothetical protein
LKPLTPRDAPTVIRVFYLAHWFPPSLSRDIYALRASVFTTEAEKGKSPALYGWQSRCHLRNSGVRARVVNTYASNATADAFVAIWTEGTLNN